MEILKVKDTSFCYNFLNEKERIEALGLLSVWYGKMNGGSQCGKTAWEHPDSRSTSSGLALLSYGQIQPGSEEWLLHF